jgi:hypothetical protein
MMVQTTLLNQFPDAAIRAEAEFYFNLSIVAYFCIIITCFNLIITNCLIIFTLFLSHFYVLEIILLHKKC